MTKELEKALKVSEYAEVRFDYLDPADMPPALDAIRGRMRRVVGTLRPRKEGGRFAGTESERLLGLATIAAARPFLLDVEYAALKGSPMLAGYLRRGRTRILVSWHDFESTPRSDKLRRIMLGMSGYSRYVKMACMAKKPEDVSRMLNMYAAKGDTNLIAFSMGDLGKASRILCLLLGSPYTYASLGAPVAPGQMDIGSVKRAIAGHPN